jgi:hypothetical protein
MNDYGYIHITYLPIWLGTFSKAYVLQAYLEQDGDHRWNAWVDALPGCTAWGIRKRKCSQLSEMPLRSMLIPALK